jgi:hypothetical protein
MIKACKNAGVQLAVVIVCITNPITSNKKAGQQKIFGQYVPFEHPFVINR